MVKKGEVPCLLGNGVCPPTCINYEAAKKAYESSLGEGMTDFGRRLGVVFGDVNPGVDIIDVTNVMAGCALEVPPVPQVGS